MKKINNKVRQLAGDKAVRGHFVDINGVRVNSDLSIMHKEDQVDAIVDTITDILHYAESLGIKSHSDICRVAQQHMMDELEQEGKE